MKEIITDVNKLGERCDEIDIRKENRLLQEIILELKEALRANKDGVGLAAPQIGYNRRVFVINFNGDIRTFINPIISEVKGLELSREGCLSIPGKQYIRPRHNQITVIYQTPLGKTESRKIFGKAAEVFQHELDHLDGLLISDIGFEVDENYDNATEEERNELIAAYLDSLDVKQHDIEKEIAEDKDLKETLDAAKFIEALQKGEVELGESVTAVKNKEDKKEDDDTTN